VIRKGGEAVEFKHENGRIYGKLSNSGEWADITDSLLPAVNDYLDYRFELIVGARPNKKENCTSE
jgi:hypothetical protein